MKNELSVFTLMVIFGIGSFFLGHSISEYTSKIKFHEGIYVETLKEQVNILQEQAADNGISIKKLNMELQGYKRIEAIMTEGIEDFKYVNQEVSVLIARAIIAAAEQYGVELELLFTVIETESSFNPNVKHPNPSDTGLGGINTRWWLEELTKQGVVKSSAELKTVIGNIEATAYVLSILHEREGGNILNILKAYKGKNSIGTVNAQNAYKMYKKLKGRI
jgi:soluble lytic murein transglycosylase-like protein